MRYIVLLGDGMGDFPLESHGGRTPLEIAHTPNMDRIAAAGQLGLVTTIPEGMPPGSDVANMNLMGYDPEKYHTGRAPLEAASMGVLLKEDDVAFRCNLVYLEGKEGDLVMGDYASGHVSSDEAGELIRALERSLGDSCFHFYPGVSYRHLLVWNAGVDSVDLTPPHDITGERIVEHISKLDNVPELKKVFEKARTILLDHPINRQRQSKGKVPANSIWLWGQGKAPKLPTYQELFGLRGGVISAVDLLKGIGVYAGLEPLEVSGATGYLDTNYEGKVRAALDAFQRGVDFVYLHVEAPDEASHEGDLDKKLRAIEDFDRRIVGPILEGLAKFPKARVLLATDHLTPISRKTHVEGPVPYATCEIPMDEDLEEEIHFTEKHAKKSGQHVDAAHKLISAFLNRDRMR